MREESAVHLGERGVGSAMVRVAVTACEVRVVVFHFAVHRSDLLHLFANGGVTVHTTVRHFIPFPQRGMTGFAIPADLGMRRDASDHFTVAPRAQVTRAVQHSSLDPGKPGNNQRGDQRRDDPRAGQTSQAIAFHFFVPSLFEEGGVIQRLDNMHKSGNEQRHADGNVNGVPESHQAARLFERFL